MVKKANRVQDKQTTKTSAKSSSTKNSTKASSRKTTKNSSESKQSKSVDSRARIESLLTSRKATVTLSKVRKSQDTPLDPRAVRPPKKRKVSRPSIAPRNAAEIEKARLSFQRSILAELHPPETKSVLADKNISQSTELDLLLGKTSVSEVARAGTISNPVPRTGEPQQNSEIERLLQIKWSKYLVNRTPTKKQTAAMMLAHIKELLYGGALGGGKSDWLAYEALRFCDLPGFSSIIFRRQLTDLKQPGSLIPRIANWLGPFAEAGDCRYVGDEHKWLFKTLYPNTDIPGPPAMLQFGYIGEAAVRERYQSAEYHLVCFDELGQWPEPTDYLFMRSRIRKTVCPYHGKLPSGLPNYVTGCRFCDVQRAIPLRVRAASNPGPPWIKRRFGIIPDPSQYPNRHAALIAISEGAKIRWVGTMPSRPFIPAYLDDNPHLDAADYREMLSEMTDDERSRLEDGNWEARKNARFKRRWQRFYQLYPGEGIGYILNDIQGNEVISDIVPFRAFQKIFTTNDPAVTTKQGPVDGELGIKNSHAVISTFGIHSDNLLFLDCRKFRKEIPDQVETLVEVNGIWQPQYNKIECNGVGIGLAQYAELAGLRVVKNYRKTDKLENSISAQIMMKAGRIWFPSNTEWAETVEDDVFSWTGLPTEEDDVVDTLCDAANELAPGVAREISAPNLVRSRPVAVSTNMAGRSMRLPHYGF